MAKEESGGKEKAPFFVRNYDSAKAALTKSQAKEVQAKQDAKASITFKTAKIASQKMVLADRMNRAASQAQEASNEAVKKAKKKIAKVTETLVRTKLLKAGAPIAQKLAEKALKAQKQNIARAMALAKKEGLDTTELNFTKKRLKKAAADLAKAEGDERKAKQKAHVKAALDGAKHADAAILSGQKAGVEKAKADANAKEKAAKVQTRR